LPGNSKVIVSLHCAWHCICFEEQTIAFWQQFIILHISLYICEYTHLCSPSGNEFSLSFNWRNSLIANHAIWKSPPTLFLFISKLLVTFNLLQLSVGFAGFIQGLRECSICPQDAKAAAASLLHADHFKRATTQCALQDLQGGVCSQCWLEGSFKID